MEAQIHADRETRLRPLLEDIERLLAVLAGHQRVDGKLLRKIARYEQARAALLRLIECPVAAA